MGSEQEPRPVGSLHDYLTLEDAAKYVGRSPRQLRYYTNKGLLPSRRFKGQGRKRWINKTDLETFLSMKKVHRGPASLWDTIAAIDTRLRIMDNHLKFLMRVNDLDISVLRDAPISVLLKPYDEACDLLEEGAEKLRLPRIYSWAEVFLQFTELEFDRLVGPAMDDQPWKIFQRFCLLLMSLLRRRTGFEGDPQMQQTYRMLDKARKHLARSALVFEELRLSRLGFNRAKMLAHLGVEEDSLDLYISAEVQKPRLS